MIRRQAPNSLPAAPIRARTVELSRRRLFGVVAAVGGASAGLGPGLRPSRRWSAAVAAQQQIEPITDRSTKYYAETGHNVQEPFLGNWGKLGGEDLAGLPLSEERFDTESGAVLQTFSGITLVYDPTLQAPWDIQGQHLSGQVVSQIAPASARKKVSGCSASAQSCTFYPETGHTISGGMAKYWSEHGQLPLLGMPLSESFKDEASGATVQVFERAVVEERSGKYGLRNTAEQIVETAGLLSDPAFLPAPPTGGTTFLVDAEDGLRLRLGPSMDAEIQAVLPDNAEFISAPGSHGDWVPGYVDGYSGWVSSDFLTAPPSLPQLDLKDWDTKVWQGGALGETNVRQQPSTKSSVVKELAYGDPVTVTAWVKGEEVFEGADLWSQVGNNQFIYARNVGRNAPVAPTPLPPQAPATGKWIDVNLTQQLMIAYSGRTVDRVAVMTSGMAGWETPPGYYSILNRVPNETMTNGAIGAEHFYKLEDVLFTQYFTDRGHAIHFAWWRTPETIGRPGSHGCLNLLLEDSRYFWDWAQIGTPLIVHY